jgi:hypothetical protein
VRLRRYCGGGTRPAAQEHRSVAALGRRIGSADLLSPLACSGRAEMHALVMQSFLV